MRDVYALFARAALDVAFGFSLVSFLLAAFGMEPYQPPYRVAAVEAAAS